MIFSIALRSLARNYRRSLAILLTVAMGCGALFIFHGFNNGVMNQYRAATIRSRYGFGQINTKGYRDQVYEKPWEHWIENPDLVATKLKAIPKLKSIFPRVEFFGLLTNGQITVSGRGQGIQGRDEAPFFNTLNVIEGETLSTQDNGILLGKGLARALKAKVGDHITLLGNTTEGSINGVDLNVVGIFHTGAKDFDDVVFRVQLTSAQTLLNTQKIETIALGLDSIDDWRDVEAGVRRDLPDLEVTSFAELDKVYYQNSVDWLDAQFGVIQSIILLVVVLGIFNTVSTGVLMRKQEIGNLRANGESRLEVMALLGSENVILGLMGAVVGIFVTWAINSTLLRNGILMPPAPGITRQFHVIVELSWWMALKTSMMGILSCVIAGSLAGLRVVRMPIAESLRSN